MVNRMLRIAAVMAASLVWLSGSIQPAFAEQADQKMIPLKVELGDVDITKIVCVIAYEEGIYKKNGLDVDQYIMKGAADSAKERGLTVTSRYVRDVGWLDAPILISGGVATVVWRTTNAAWVKQDRIVLATLDRVVHWQIMARPEIKTLEDLKGKRLGSGTYRGGGMTDYIALVLAKRMGWDPIRDISMMGNWGLDSLKSGSVDAIVASEVPEATARAAGFHPVGDPRSWREIIAGSGVIAPRAWVKDNPEATRRFMKSLVEAIALMKQNKAVAFRGIAKWFNVTDPEQQKLLYDGNREMPSKPYPFVDGIKRAMELYDGNEMRRYKAEDFYDSTFVKELDQSGFIDGLYKQ